MNGLSLRTTRAIDYHSKDVPADLSVESSAKSERYDVRIDVCEVGRKPPGEDVELSRLISPSFSMHACGVLLDEDPCFDVGRSLRTRASGDSCT